MIHVETPYQSFLQKIVNHNVIKQKEIAEVWSRL